MALSNARARQIGRQMAQGGGGGAGSGNPHFGSILLSAHVLTFGGSAGDAIGVVSCANALASFSLVDDAGGQVALSGANLQIGANTVAGDGGSFPIVVRATVGVQHRDQMFIINVADAAITDITLSAASVTSGSAANTVVGNLASVPTGATLTLTNTASGKFKIASGVLKTDTIATNKLVNATETVTVHAVHGTATFDKDFTITIS